MAYININDTGELVRRLQQKLRDLSRWLEDDNLLVAADGFYDNGTEMAVRSFQSKYGLNPTGVTDITTWELIEKVHRENAEKFGKSRSIFPFPNERNRKVSLGERSTLVFVIQIILNELRLYYDGYGYIPLNGRFDITTSEAVREFQRAGGLQPSGEVDRGTWNRLADEYNLAVTEGNR